MSVEILGKIYIISKTTNLDLSKHYQGSLPESIGELTNLLNLSLANNNLTSLPPESINILVNLPLLWLEISSYQINNLDPECEFLLITSLKEPLINLPTNLKKLYLIKPKIDTETIKVPFGCEIIIK